MWGSKGTGNGQFEEPTGIEVDKDGNILVIEWYGMRVQKFSPDGTFITKWGSLGSGNGELNRPFEIAIDGSGYIYIAEADNYRVQKFKPDGSFYMKWGSSGSGAGQFNLPRGVAVDSTGNTVYIVDTGNNRIQKFTRVVPSVTTITPANGLIGTIVGSITVTGNNFHPGAIVELTKEGHSNIIATDLTITPTSITGNINLAGAAVGSWNVVVTNEDGQKGTLLNGFQITQNNPPNLDLIGDKTVNEGMELNFTLSATDPEGQTLTYSSSTLPTGASFIEKTFIWTPGNNQVGIYPVTFTVSDGDLTDTEDINITVSESNRAPELASIGNKSVDDGQPLNFAISATDADGDTLTYSATGLPAGATFSGNTFSWSNTVAGSYQVTFSVTDGIYTDSETITLKVINPYQWSSIGPDGRDIVSVAVSPSYGTDTTIAGGTDYPGNFTKTVDNGATWRFVNPIGAPNYVGFGGIAFSPGYQTGGSDQTVYLVGGNNGGLSRTTDGGTTWVNKIPTIPLADIALSTPNTVYAASDYGVYKSTDAGVSFSKLTTGGAPTGQCLAAAVASDGTVYIGTSNSGIYKSTDSGANWIQVNTGLPTGNVYDVVVAPDQTVFAMVCYQGIYRSKDQGASWTLVNNEYFYSMYQGLAISPNYASDHTIFAAYATKYDSWMGVAMSQDGGDNWVHLGTTTPMGIRPAVIAVSPTFASDRTIFAGTSTGIWKIKVKHVPVLAPIGNKMVNEGQQTTFTMSATDGDAGDTLTYSATGFPIGSTFNAGTRTFTWTSPVAGSYQVTFSVTDGTYTDSETITLKVINPYQWSSIGPDGRDIVSVAVSPSYGTDSTIAGGTDAPGNFTKTVDNGATWQFVNPIGAPNYVTFGGIAFSPGYQTGGSDQTVYLLGGNNLGLLRSTDGGRTWVNKIPTIPLADITLSTPNTVYTASDYGVYKSTDAGVSFSKLTTGGAPTGQCLAAAVASDGTVYIGTSNSGIYKSNDNGANWLQVNTGLPTGNVYDIGVAPDQTVFAMVCYQGIYRSKDQGASWTLVNNEYFYSMYQGLAISPNYASDHTIFAAYATKYDSWMGVAMSQDGGDNWVHLGTTTPMGIRPAVIAVSPTFASDRTIFAGTSTGIWKIKVKNVPVLGPIGNKMVNEGQQLTFTVSATDGDAGDTLTYSATGLPTGSTFNAGTRTFTWTSPVAGSYSVKFDVTDGTYTDTETVTVKVINPYQWSSIGPDGRDIVSVAVSPSYGTDSTIAGGTYAPGNFTKTVDNGATWQFVNPIGTPNYATFGGIAFSPGYQTGGSDQTVYLLGGNNLGLLRSTDGGTTWVNKIPTIPLADIALSTPNTVYAASDYGVYKSTDAGVSFSKLTTGGAPTGQCLAAAVASDGTVYIGTSNSGIYKSTDSGANWIQVNTGLPTGNVYDIGVAPDQTVFAMVCYQGIYRSKDQGASWTLVNNEYFYSMYQGLAISPNYASDHTIFAAYATKYDSWMGVAMSQDGGDNWVHLGTTTPMGIRPAVIAVSPTFASDRTIFAGTSTGIWKIKVKNVPVLGPIGNKMVNEGQQLTFTVSATDGDAGDTLTYSATGLPTESTFNAGTRTFTWTPTYNQAGTYPVTFTVSDGIWTDTEAITINVTNANRAPVLASIGVKSTNENQLLTFTISASDPDGDALTYNATGVPGWATFNADTKIFSGTPGYTDAGSSNVTFSVTDGSTPVSEIVTITVNNANRAPVLESIGSKYVDEGIKLEFAINASDPDNDGLTYSATSVPGWATFDSLTKTFTGTPGYSDAGTFLVTFTVSDGSLSETESITISVSDVNRAPELGTVGDKSVAEGSALTFSLVGSDADGQTLTYSSTALPAGATLTGADFAWTPTFEQAGTYPVTFTVSDGSSTDTEDINIVVSDLNRAPTLASIGNKNIAEGSPLTFTLVGTDADGQNLTYSSTSLPTGATLTGANFAWTPTFEQAGTYPVTFTVSDGVLTDTEAISIIVSDLNRAPTLASIGNKNIAEGSPLTFTLSGTDADGQTLTYSSTALPAGATLTGANFAWTPTFEQAGPYPVTFTVSDGSLTDTESITITVTDLNRAPELGAVGDKSVAEGSPLTFSLSAIDQDGQALTYSSTALPAGATLTGANFAWTPTFEQAGTYPVTFTVSDGVLTDTEAISIIVSDLNRAPELGDCRG